MSVMIPILLYHSIAEDVAPGFSTWAIGPGLFAAHMAYLHDQGYTPITVTQLGAAITNSHARLPDLPVVLTFDDGFADFYSDALPVLQRYSFAATLYIVTGFVGGKSCWLHREGEGKRPMLTWDQIAEISASGVECGAHSYTHPQLDTLTPFAARDEIMRSKTVLEHHLDQPVVTFAYPQGYYSPAIRRLVQQAGYSSACAVKHATSSITDDRFALARIMVTSNIDVAGFGRLLSGLGLRVAPTRERLRTKGWRLARWLTRRLKRRPLTETEYG